MTRRIALFSDVHGNLHALDAVLADIHASAVAERYCLGDLVGYGAEPAAVVERVRSLSIPTVRGNYDQGVGTRAGSCGCFYATPSAAEEGEASYAFTDAALTDADREWLASLPEQIRLSIDGARILFAHGSPRKINEYLLPDRSEQQLARLADEAEADLVCVGHVHIPYHRSFPAEDGRRCHYISSGSVGKPKDGDPRACWVELVLGSEAEIAAAAPGDESAAPVGGSALWAGTLVHRVEYDVEAAARAMVDAGLPSSLAEALFRA